MCQSSPLTLIELLELDALQSLQDSFAAVSGVSIALIDANGNEVTRSTVRNDLCSRVHCEKEREQCRIALVNRAIADVDFKQPEVSLCQMQGVASVAVPIRVDDIYLGSWLIGQVVLEDEKAALLQRLMETIKINQEEAEELVRELPVMSCADFNRLHRLLHTVTAMLIKLGHNCRQLALQDRELRGITREMQIRDQVLSRFIQSSGDAMYISDYYTGEILMVNESYSLQADEPMYRLLGRKCWEVNGLSEDGFCSFCPRALLLDEQLQPGNPYTWEYYNEKFGLWLRCTHQAITWAGGRAAHMVTQQDTTKKHEAQAELERLAFYDTITELPNSNMLAKRIRETIEAGEALYNRTMVCLHFSSLRVFLDLYGVDAENAIVRVIKDWLLTQEYDDSELYRLGRDEFCLVLRNVPQEFVLQDAQRISDRFTAPWLISLEGTQFSFMGGVTISLVHISPAMTSHDEILLLVSRTMAKARVSKGLVVYDEEMDQAMRRHMQLELSLKHCINLGMKGFWLCYQPIVELKSGLWKGVEALCRWNDPEQGDTPVSPLVFIKEAERQGLITPLGNWVLENAIQGAKTLALDETPGFFLSVNISPMQMMEGDFADNVLDILRRNNFPGRVLNLEVTESVEMTFTAFTLSMIERLRAEGVRFALDDFGTGYSSFQNLKHLPVDFLKTERDFIDGIERDDYMQYFFYIISEITHANNLKLITEGVETEEQLAMVRANGGDYIQGYYFSKPLPLEALSKRKTLFSTPEPTLIPLAGEMLNIRQWLAGKSAYELTPSLFMMLNQCVEILFFSTDADTVIERVLAVAGKQYEASRSFAFVQEQGTIFSNRYEWCNDGIQPQKHLFESIDLLDESPSLYEAFNGDGMIVASDISKLPPDLYAGLRRSSDIQSVALMPMFDEKLLIGFVGFEHVTYHTWSPEEIVMLWTLSMCVAHSVNKEKLKSEVEAKRHLLDSVLRNSGLGVYVSTVDTDEILWVNDVLEQGYADGRDLIGRKCYEVFFNAGERCAFCKKQHFGLYPDVGHFSYERYNAYLDRYYSAYETLIRWVDGRVVHIAYVLDNTETVKAHKEMEHLRTIDVQTGTLNRRTALETLRGMCDKAVSGDEELSVAVINVTNLRKINATFGHQVGDRALLLMVEALRESMTRADVMGRFSGDEFMMGYAGCAIGEAQERLDKAAKRLLGMRPLPEVALSFSRGIAELAELRGKGGAASLEALLALAETRMRESKAP